jgi:hypothetical protein
LEKNVDRDRGTSVSILQFLTDSFFPVGLTGKLFSSGGLRQVRLGMEPTDPGETTGQDGRSSCYT